MKGSLRQSMAWMHTWAGLVLGWLLFAMFLTGTASYFRPEISNWMQPELSHAEVTQTVAAENAFRTLGELAPASSRWFISLPDARDPGLRVSWLKPGGGFETRQLDPATGQPISVRQTYGGQFFYRFHFELHMPRPIGRWVAGAAAMVMFVTIISGIIIHRRIFKDFFTFRPKKAAQRSWLDGHNALAVLALPYHLMITYTGLITLMFTYLPWGILSLQPDGRAGMNAEIFAVPQPPKPAGRQAALSATGPIMTEAALRWPDMPVGQITVYLPGDANALVELAHYVENDVRYSRHALQFNGTTGAFIAELGNDKPVSTIRQVLYGLHLGRFGGWDLRALLFISGLMGTAMVGSGLVLWAVKRRARAETRAARFGIQFVERLNIAVILGLPIAMAAFLWANRLLPAGMVGRADREALVFFLIWLTAALYSACRPSAAGWRELLAVAAPVCLALPVAGWLTVGVVDLGFDAALFAIGLGFLLTWRHVRRRTAHQLQGRITERPA